ncbi:MAG: hypothetical protein Q4C87_07405 [Actinomycetaceae bacterium]|nr:hypothetical protein [Actinomycetaceae bacterium]
MNPDTWLERYESGCEDAIWNDMRQLGAAIRQPEYYEHAVAVCDAMAHRARRNIEKLIERLSGEGYIFHSLYDEEKQDVSPLIPPTSDAPDLARWLDEQFTIPLSVHSWIRIVGDVSFIGTHPDWPESSAADPLMVEFEYSEVGGDPREYHVELYEDWRDSQEGETPAEPFLLEFAPDRLHKDDTSGGAPYAILTSDACAEGVVRAEHDYPLVSYFNSVFECGGFPHGPALGQYWRYHKLGAGLETL